MNGSKVIMYANDGSAMNGVVSFVVQSPTIDGKLPLLPNFSIFTETGESLEELEIMTFCFCWVQVQRKTIVGLDRLCNDRLYESQFDCNRKSL